MRKVAKMWLRKANFLKDKEPVGEEIKLPKEEEDAKARNEGGKKMRLEGKLSTIKSPKKRRKGTHRWVRRLNSQKKKKTPELRMKVAKK